MSTVGDIMSTVGGYLEYRGGVQYRGGYHEKCGGYLEYRGGYHEYCGGCSVPWEENLLLFEYPTVLNTPHSTQDNPHGTEHPHITQDIPHGTQDILPRYS